MSRRGAVSFLQRGRVHQSLFLTLVLLIDTHLRMRRVREQRVVEVHFLPRGIVHPGGCPHQVILVRCAVVPGFQNTGNLR